MSLGYTERISTRMQRFSKPLNLFGRPLAVAYSPMTASLLTLRPRSTRSQATSRMRKEGPPQIRSRGGWGTLAIAYSTNNHQVALPSPKKIPSASPRSLIHPSMTAGRARSRTAQRATTMLAIHEWLRSLRSTIGSSNSSTKDRLSRARTASIRPSYRARLPYRPDQRDHLA